MERICSEFQIGTSGLKRYQGKVMIDADNLYMLVGINVNLFAIGGLGGAVGGLIAGAASQMAASPKPQPFETTFGELPAEQRRESEWGRVDRRAKVLVVPRSSAKIATCSFWSGCKIKTESLKILLPIPPWGFFKARRLLVHYDWVPDPA